MWDFRLRMWEIWNCQWFLSLQLQINLLKMGFERKNQLRTHLKRSTIQFKYDFVSYLTLQKWNIPCKQCHMLISLYIVTWAHTWGNSTGHISVTYFCLWLLHYQSLMPSLPIKKIFSPQPQNSQLLQISRKKFRT